MCNPLSHADVVFATLHWALRIAAADNKVNGVPTCASQPLLTSLLRGKWGFDGYVTSDCDAIGDIHEFRSHWFAPTPEHAVAMGLNAGCDLDCGSTYREHATGAVDANLLRVAAIERSLHRLIKTHMRLGLYAPKEQQAYFNRAAYGISQVDHPAHRALAYDAALQGKRRVSNAGRATGPLAR